MKNKRIILASIFLLLFIINTILVVTGCTTNVDSAVHEFAFSLQSDLMDSFMKVCTFFGSAVWIVVLSFILVVGLLLFNLKKLALFVAATIGSSTLINTIIKNIIRRPRAEYIRVIEKSFSYPSGHTMASISLYGFIIYVILKSHLDKGIKTLLICILSIACFLILFSRIYLGAHYFSDIIGGTLCSLFLLTIVSIYYDKVFKKIK